MRNVQTVITNPAVNPVMIGTLLLRPARRNVKVRTNTLAQVQVIPAAVERLAAASIKAVNAQTATNGMEKVVPLIVIMMKHGMVLNVYVIRHTTLILVPERQKLATENLATANTNHVFADICGNGMEILAPTAETNTSIPVAEKEF